MRKTRELLIPDLSFFPVKVTRSSLDPAVTTEKLTRADRPFTLVFSGGGERDRTDDLLRAKQALSQLSYTPVGGPR